MPLHLLGKKSWNPYNPAAIARVAADEEAYEDLQREYADRVAKHESARRLAELRGEEFTARSPTPPPAQINSRDGERKRRADFDFKDDRRDRDRKSERDTKRRRGEDDTERDIRVAKTRVEEPQTRPRAQTQASIESGQPDLIDSKGHIQLFNPPSTSQSKTPHQTSKERRREAYEKRKAEEAEGGMRFKNAAGYDQASALCSSSTASRAGPSAGPWYARSQAHLHAQSKYSGTEEVDALDAVNVDPDSEARKLRDEKRVASADPLSAMRAGVRKMKNKEKDRIEQREEMARLREEQERGFRREERIRRMKLDEGRRRERKEWDRSRERERERERERHHGFRSGRHRDGERATSESKRDVSLRRHYRDEP